jgi:hypothetical protein
MRDIIELPPVKTLELIIMTAKRGGLNGIQGQEGTFPITP